jgi:N-methylhydantoinase A
MLPTVTDAHVVLGHFAGGGLLGDEFALDETRATTAMAELAKTMSRVAGRKIEATSAAEGVIAVVNSNMERALRRISVERGHDPREFNLVPFGGAGGLHAVALARALGVPRVIVPSSPGALSAIGVVAANVVTDHSRTVMLQYQRGVEAKLASLFRELERSARAKLSEEGFASSRQRHERSVALRYQGQSFDLEINAASGDLAANFHRAHETRYGYSQKENAIEIVSVRLRSSGLVEQRQEKTRKAVSRPAKAASSTYAYFEGKRSRVQVYERGRLSAGMKLRAPCIVKEYSATTLIPTGVQARVDGSGNMIIEC